MLYAPKEEPMMGLRADDLRNTEKDAFINSTSVKVLDQDRVTIAYDAGI